MVWEELAAVNEAQTGASGGGMVRVGCGGGIGGEAGADLVLEGGDGGLVRGEDVKLEVGEGGAEADGEVEGRRDEDLSRWRYRAAWKGRAGSGI